MIHHKLSETTVVDGKIVIEADGNHHSVEADTDGVDSVTLQGNLPGSLVVLGDHDCDACRAGDGAGDVMRWGTGRGKAYRSGKGDGNAHQEGSGDGSA